MKRGLVHDWVVDPAHPLGGRIVTRALPLPHVDHEGRGIGRLWGRFVRVRNAAAVNRPDPLTTLPRPVPLGDALPDDHGDFLFDPGRGGSRVDTRQVRSPKYLNRYIAAAHFGEVNTYFHIDRIASYVDELLHELGAASLPRVIAVVNAHAASVDITPGVRDGVQKRNGGWRPFKGGHYRLPARGYAIGEHEPISPDGEIHLGVGWRLAEHGALAESAGQPYRANASHNAGILYHEYGHHISRHTADFMVNRTRPSDRQNNRKTALDEAVCDYWAAAMLQTPHIWGWHQRHDAEVMHVRSLASPMTMADYDHSESADPHANGTIFAAALWEMRRTLSVSGKERVADALVLRMLLSLASLGGNLRSQTIEIRSDYGVALSKLLEADQERHGGEHRELIEGAFAGRNIRPSGVESRRSRAVPRNKARARSLDPALELEKLRQRVGPDEVPASEDLLSAGELEARLLKDGDPQFSLVAVGDVMLWGRARQHLQAHGDDYPFAATLPLLRRAGIGLANHEGPMACNALKAPRNFSYRVPPRLAPSLRRAGLNVVALANNHLTDCGRQGVVETLSALRKARVVPIGAGLDRTQAHRAAILSVGALRVGFLGYYWNRRTAATKSLPGSAMDTPDDLARDIAAVRPLVDRLVVTHHWGIPYVREVSPEDRAKARLAIDCGADLVIGHHPHIIQAFEEYRSRPIFYSLGNFAFGSGNSRAESLLLGVRFDPAETSVSIYPVYVKNRDPRVAYQPKVLSGNAAKRILDRLRSLSGPSAEWLAPANDTASVKLAWALSAVETRAHG